MELQKPTYNARRFARYRTETGIFDDGTGATVGSREAVTAVGAATAPASSATNSAARIAVLDTRDAVRARGRHRSSGRSSGRSRGSIVAWKVGGKGVDEET